MSPSGCVIVNVSPEIVYAASICPSMMYDVPVSANVNVMPPPEVSVPINLPSAVNSKVLPSCSLVHLPMSLDSLSGIVLPVDAPAVGGAPPPVVGGGGAGAVVVTAGTVVVTAGAVVVAVVPPHAATARTKPNKRIASPNAIKAVPAFAPLNPLKPDTLHLRLELCVVDPAARILSILAVRANGRILSDGACIRRQRSPSRHTLQEPRPLRRV
jgi:hypothetical protein